MKAHYFCNLIFAHTSFQEGLKEEGMTLDHLFVMYLERYSHACNHPLHMSV